MKKSRNLYAKLVPVEKLKEMTILPPTGTWNMGEFRKKGKSNYTFSNFTILPDPEPDGFQDKLNKLLDYGFAGHIRNKAIRSGSRYHSKNR